MKFPTTNHFYTSWLTEGEAAGPALVSELVEDEEATHGVLDNTSNEPLPILTSQSVVLFPDVILPITLRNAGAISLVKQLHKSEGLLGIVAEKEEGEATGSGREDRIYHTGTTAKVLRVLVLPDGHATVLLRGIERFYIETLVKDAEDWLLAEVFALPSPSAINTNRKAGRALVQSVRDTALRLLKLEPEAPSEMASALVSIKNPNFLIGFLTANLNMDLSFKQWLLELDDDGKRAKELLKYLLKEQELLELKRDIQNKVHTDLEQQQRDYYLRQHIKVLQDELGEKGASNELETLRKRGDKRKWPAEVQQHFSKALDKLERLNPHSAEYPPQLNYVEFLLDLPWAKYTKDKFDLKQAEKVLNKQHYGLKKVKERILEYLAVLQLRQELRGPILCLHGPPGVGKTSLGKSIADALGRKYVRMSLGGISDEAEIRGHRKTYVGAMAGKILTSIKKAGTCNPVFVLDEVDKIDRNFRGDPAAALLEVLDPEQNNAFADNFAEVPYDLSRVLFILTANEIDDIPWALHDRVEAIEVSGYAVEEKLHIAKQHLLPKQKREHGLKTTDLGFNDAALTEVIQHYTRESGVRDLERQLGTIARKVAKSMVMEEPVTHRLKKSDVSTFLGSPKVDLDTAQRLPLPGIAIGLSWSPVGGGILFMETSLAKGKGKVTVSGQLGEVMEESAMAALSYLRAHADELHIDHRVFDQYDLHIHVPDGATPKDGPSAGITLFIALASLYTQRKVKDGLAMSGEITLRGKVLPVGGIKEKVLAAQRAGIKNVILSKQNERDVKEIDADFIKQLQFHYIDTVDELLGTALHARKVKGAKTWELEEPSQDDD